MNRFINGLKEKARALKKETYALYFAARHERTPWSAKLAAALVVGYALSPIDFIPDFIPIVGYLDDLVIVPLGIALTIKMIPVDVLAECRQQAQARIDGGKPTNWVAAAVIILVWLSLGTLLAILGWRYFAR